MRLDDMLAWHLASLPAVRCVYRSSGRLVYERGFMVAAVAAWRAGVGVVRVFRLAGLPPELIGRKRIERCAYRWRRDPEITAEACQVEHPTDLSRWKPDVYFRQSLTIFEQARRIARLEDQVRLLKSQAAELSVSAGRDGDSDGRGDR